MAEEELPLAYGTSGESALDSLLPSPADAPLHAAAPPMEAVEILLNLQHGEFRVFLNDPKPQFEM